MKRRKFVIGSLLTGIPSLLGLQLPGCSKALRSGTATSQAGSLKYGPPVVVSTWNTVDACRKGWDVLQQGRSSLDAVEAGVMVEEANPDNHTVGFGGRPDRDGHVTLDACIMDAAGNYGSVAFLERIRHPVSVARKVMEKTPHVILAGDGALQFAIDQGFEAEELLTDETRKQWMEWQRESKYKPRINIEDHDTIGMLAIDVGGKLSGACTTSGIAYKMRGRVGDSPIIGSGLFVDNEVGAAVATGLGEEILKSVGTFLVVELMRQGWTPRDACREAVRRTAQRTGERSRDFQVAYLAVSSQGEVGAFSLQRGFLYALHHSGGDELVNSDSWYPGEGSKE